MNQSDIPRVHRNYFIFTFWNTISFNLLAGNIILLYALRLGGGNVLVGLLTAMDYSSFFIPLIGRHFIRKMGAVKMFGTFWILRYLSMILVLMTILPAIRHNPLLLLTCFCIPNTC